VKLTELCRAINGLRSCTAPWRRQRLTELLTDLRALAVDTDVAMETRKNLTLKALRAISPRSEHQATPAATVGLIERFLADPRGLGRPPSGRDLGAPRTIRLPENLDKAVQAAAVSRGIPVSVLIGELVGDALERFAAADGQELAAESECPNCGEDLNDTQECLTCGWWPGAFPQSG
jgi:hypothetical protein